MLRKAYLTFVLILKHISLFLLEALCFIADSVTLRSCPIKEWTVLNLPDIFLTNCYRIFSVIRQNFSFLYSPKNLDLSYKMAVDLWYCLGKVNLVL